MRANTDTYVKENIPDVDSPLFVDIDLMLQMTQLINGEKIAEAELFPTGRLTYGNANPECENYNSLADFISAGDYIEIRIAWQLLNFSDPSTLQIHDDYFDNNYGIEPLNIDSIYIGIGNEITSGRIHLVRVPMEGWKNRVTYHERLKPAYYVMQNLWRDADEG